MSKHREELEHRLKLRNIKLSDYDNIREIMISIYRNQGGAWTKAELKNQLKAFPKAKFVLRIMV